MTDTLFTVQQAVLNALKARAEVQSLLGASPAIYDHVPPGATFPFVVYGAAHVLPYDAATVTGFQQNIALDIYSRYRGGKEAHDIFQALYDALHKTTLSVAGAIFVSSTFDSADFMLENDGLTTHVAVHFVIITQNA